MYRSDPILQHAHGHSSGAGQQSTADRPVPVASVPPADSHNVKPGTGIIRDGSIRNLVNCYENKVFEVTCSLHIYF